MSGAKLNGDLGISSSFSRQLLQETFPDQPPSKSLSPDEIPAQSQHGHISPGFFMISASNGFAVHPPERSDGRCATAG
jgi:hypothetical protein